MKMSEAKVGMGICDPYLFPQQVGKIVGVTNTLIYVLFGTSMASYSAVQFTRVKPETQVSSVCPRANDGNSNKHSISRNPPKAKLSPALLATLNKFDSARPIMGESNRTRLR